MTAEKTHWRKLQDNKYLGAYAIAEGADLVVTIKDVKRELIDASEGHVEDACVAYLEGGLLPWIVNITNAKSIARLHGEFIEDWVGKTVTLYKDQTKLDGELVDCIRVKAERPAPPPRSISDARLAQALAQVEAGEYTVEKLRERFILSPEQEARINEGATE
jgi:hypothetical protein